MACASGSKAVCSPPSPRVPCSSSASKPKKKNERGKGRQWREGETERGKGGEREGVEREGGEREGGRESVPEGGVEGGEGR